MAHNHKFKTPEEIEYAKKRLIAYFMSGFHRTVAMKKIRMSESAFKNKFANDPDIIEALKYVPKK